uniref:Uncharacterized protein n=1 Tax=Arundo donax TaxID=35708 RepID=A0A0A9BWN9_ARUDO
MSLMPHTKYSHRNRIGVEISRNSKLHERQYFVRSCMHLDHTELDREQANTDSKKHTG